jgi:hypothetical protein
LTRSLASTRPRRRLRKRSRVPDADLGGWSTKVQVTPAPPAASSPPSSTAIDVALALRRKTTVCTIYNGNLSGAEAPLTMSARPCRTARGAIVGSTLRRGLSLRDVKDRRGMRLRVDRKTPAAGRPLLLKTLSIYLPIYCNSAGIAVLRDGSFGRVRPARRSTTTASAAVPARFAQSRQYLRHGKSSAPSGTYASCQEETSVLSAAHVGVCPWHGRLILAVSYRPETKYI